MAERRAARTNILVPARYAIKTEGGWQPLPIIVDVPQQTMENPFRCWQRAGAASYAEWLRRSG